jgi:predicted ATPase
VSAVPEPRTPLVGRGTELAAVASRLEEGTRLVTITGPPGIGKSRVAAEIARRSAAGREVLFVDALEGPDAVAVALGARDLDAALPGRGPLVLVLDRLPASAAKALGDWLEQAPDLVAIVASRERTGLPDEEVHELGPLAPSEAEALFVHAARRARPGWTPSAADREAIAEIARATDGVPLAIDLAAARMGVMGARALLHRLNASLGEIRGLDAALEGSWAALSADAQQALARATVFRAPFTADAAEAVSLAPLDALAELRDKSLLFGREDLASDLRLGMYAPIRDHAARRLDPADRAAAEGRHAAWFIGLAEAHVKELHGPRAKAARARLLAERAELLAIARAAVGPGPLTARAAEPALRAVLALAPVLLSYGPLNAYEGIVDPVITASRASGADPRLVAEVVLVRGMLARHRGRPRDGARDLVQALGVARTLHDASLEARALHELGHALADDFDAVGAEGHFRRAADLHASARDAFEEGRARASLAELLPRAGRADEARAEAERARALHETAGEDTTSDLLALGAAELAAGRLAASRAASEAARTSARTIGDRRAEAVATMQIGLGAQRAAERVVARQALEEARAIFADLGFVVLEATAQGHIGLVARDEGKDAEAAVRLAQACDALKGAPGGAAPFASAPASAALSDDALVVAVDGTWFRAPRGARIDLTRRRPIARILARLANERLERPGAPLGSRALRDAAWPGERMLDAAGAHRVRVAVSTLRKLGLEDLLVTTGEGYALDARVPIVCA